MVPGAESHAQDVESFPMISFGSSRSSSAVALCGLILLASCGGSSTDPAADAVEVILPPAAQTAPVPAFALPAQAYDDRSFYATTPGFTPEQYAEIAAMPMAMFQLRWCLSAEAVPVIAQLRALNPDLVIIGVLSLLSRPDSWAPGPGTDRFPLSSDLYDLLSDRPVISSEGEEVLMWSDAPMFNPMRGHGIDTALLTRMVNVIAHYATVYPGQVDGIMHDYTSSRPFAFPAGDASLEGFIDLDGDGTAFGDDPDEIAAWRGWQCALADQLQERFGPGLIQIANGRLPLDDADYAQRMAGVIFQKFPRLVWDWPAQQGLDTAIRMREPGQITPRRGHYWNFYWAATTTVDGMTDFRRYASLLTGDFYETNSTLADEFRGADPDRVELGSAVGSMTRTRVDETEVYARDFEGGTVSIEFNALGNASAMGISPRR